jgi:hypothetical protein
MTKTLFIRMRDYYQVVHTFLSERHADTQGGHRRRDQDVAFCVGEPAIVEG